MQMKASFLEKKTDSSTIIFKRDLPFPELLHQHLQVNPAITVDSSKASAGKRQISVSDDYPSSKEVNWN